MPMKILIRAIITGFGWHVGAALYKRVAKQLGLDDKTPENEATRAAAAAASDPGALHVQPEA